MKPLVSVICVCYNHEPYVLEALESAKAQTYPNVEIIIVDDGSRDRSVSVIEQWVSQNPDAQFLNLKINAGYCKAFNKGFALAKGEYIIDLATDDILHPDRISVGVQGFLKKGEKYGAHFSDAEHINQDGQVVSKHSDKYPHHQIPQDDIYVEVIQRYFICSPTLMVRKSILDSLGGYDERLHYEDFNLWVCTARNHLFFYIPQLLVKKRIIPTSLGRLQYARNSQQLESTWLVCKKIFSLNKMKTERRALNHRIGYELKWNVRYFNIRLVLKYLILLSRNMAYVN